MTAFSRATADESNRLLQDFIDAVFADRPDDPFASRLRSALPVLPDQPTDQQIDAWVELAALVQDPAFRSRFAQMVTEGARLRSTSGISETDAATQRAGATVVERAGEAVARGIAPASREAMPIVDDVVKSFADAAHRRVSPSYRADLLQQLVMFSDRRVERYWQLIAAINGWPEVPSMMAAYEWLIAALGARISQS